MFHRRRASSNPPPKTPPTAAASTAAVQAFLTSRASNANLSNAAAAAALRSRPTTPTPVGDIPTKRRAQRSGSVSSNGSARPTLQRRNSSGSMTERTFRDPSPSQGSTGNQYRYDDDAPPVPALPKVYGSPPPVPTKSIRRPASVEPPERVTSPVPMAGARGVSLDRGPGIAQGQQTKKKQVTTLAPVGEMERAQSRESINFSRPMSPQNSPPVSPLRDLQQHSTTNQTQALGPKANMVALRDGEADNIHYAVQNTATRPVKKKKRAVAKDMVEGSHFAGGGGAKPTGTATERPSKAPASVSSKPSPADHSVAAAAGTVAPKSAPKKKKKRVVSSESSQGSYNSDSDSAMSDLSSSADRPRTFNTRAARLLTKQPSVVREEREAEEQEEGKKSAKQTLIQNGRTIRAPLASTSEIPAATKQHKKSASQPPVLSTSMDRSPLNVPGAALITSDTKDLAPQQPRPKSLSPGRAAHFLAQPTYETSDGTKHQPPARSVSPVKSALKHSPSSRGASPVGFATGGPSRLSGVGSEASYDSSAVSDDSGRLFPVKKKGARVSFDEESVILGRASTPPATESPTMLSPQHKEGGSKGFLGFGRRKKGEVSSNEAGQDDGIRPTPVLPSFGSIRAKKKGEIDTVPQRTDDQNVNQRPLLEAQMSSDQVVGHVLSQDFASKKDAGKEHAASLSAANGPLPPEVTSVEGTGYHSDNEESDGEEVEHLAASAKSPPAGKETEPRDVIAATEPNTADTNILAEDKPAIMQNGSVPAIAILPATPGIGSPENEQEDWFKMPGGFSAATDDDDGRAAPDVVNNEGNVSSASSALHHATDLTPANLGISEPEPDSTATTPAGSPIIGHVAEGIHQQKEGGKDDESDDTGNSIYSDAAEDLSDVEGDGFGSINAIIESPVVPKTPFVSPAAKTPSPSAKTVRPGVVTRSESELSEPPPEEGWDRAQAYWSGLSQSRKEQLERAAIPGAVDEPSATANNASTPVKKPKKKMVKKAPLQNDPPLPPWPDREFRQDVARSASPGTSHMKSSMRSSQPSNSQPTMRASMRGNAPPKSALRNSVQIAENEPAAEGLQRKTKKKDRPVSAVAMVHNQKPNGKPAPGHGRAASLGVTPKTLAPVAPLPKKTGKPALRRAISDGSDSSSSFKKTKPSTSDGKYTMKRTMRGGSMDGRPPSAYGDRQISSSARSMSPPARRPFSTAGPGGMRTSMRDSMDSGLGSRTKSPSSSFGFRRNSKLNHSEPKKAGSRFSSRFGDSSDEDEVLPKRGSRFVDSSDEEEERPGLTPVRGIPRRIDEGDSTDLEDSSASPSPKIGQDGKPLVLATSATHKPLEGSAPAKGSLHSGATEPGSVVQANKAAKKEKKKRSFFGSRRKQQPQPPLDNSLPTTNPTPSTPRPLEPAYTKRADIPSSPQSPKAANLVGSPSVTASPKSQASPKPPKLQRRNTPKRFASDSWPLPEMPAAAAGKGRPSTADGAAGKPLALGSMRPKSGPRRFTAEGEPVNGAAVGGKEAGKRKRFPMLRKALRL
ncbi:MAG: hypothetical protein LQ343_005659 [Gyalolechia ehrenbergii]|nr:MAG: hypothetical protein LQ343_005659 [Gyalolechia ehrenbergii]